MNKRVLVTGVAGFIGSNLTHALLQRKYEVVGVDNFSLGDPLNMSEFRDHPAFTLHNVDVRDEQGMYAAGLGCDQIVHLAAYKIPRYGDALETLQINAWGSENAVKVALRNRAKIVVASTSDVYGKNPELPFREDSDLVIGPPTVRRWAYAISKMFEEQLYLAYRERHGIDVVILRLFGGYGPNQHLSWWGGPQSVFIQSALEDRELEVHGDGQQTRSFTYISDHVECIIRCLEREAVNGHVLNIGSTHEVTIEQLARMIWRLVQGAQPAKIRYVPYSTFGKYEDVRRRLPDISLATALLGFVPEVDLENGLKRTVEWQVARQQALGRRGPQP